MYHKAAWIGHPMRIELTRVGLLVYLANHYTTRGTREQLIRACNRFQPRIEPVIDASGGFIE